MPAFVQKTTATGAAGTSITSPAFGSSTTVGNQLINLSSVFNGVTGNNVTSTDSKVNTWSQDKQIEAAGAGGFTVATISQTILTIAGASHTVTTTASKTASDLQASAIEVSSSTSSIDQSQTATAASGTTTITATTAATTQAVDILIAAFAPVGSLTTAGILSPCNVNGSQTGVVAINVVQDDTTVTGYQGSYKILAATGTQAVNYTYTTDASGGYALAVVVYQGRLVAGATFLPNTRTAFFSNESVTQF